MDYDFFDPATDDYIPFNYSHKQIEHKRKNKVVLQERLGLPKSKRPLVGMIGRLAAQKGWDLIAEVADKLLKLDLQLVVLGAGEEEYQQMLQQMQKKYPKKLGLTIGFDAQLAQLIYAASDMFLMPSRYEPCGLGQLIALRYGSIPIVRATGGLADTIENYSAKTKKGNGFSFVKYSSSDMLKSIKRALDVYADKKSWKALMKKGMQQDYSWEHSANLYLNLYKKALKKRR